MSAWPARRLAAAAVLLLGGYLQLVEWVDLFPWNDVRRGNGQAGLNLALAAVTPMLAAWLWFSRRWAPLAAAAALGLWAWLQIQTWWIPYVITGASPGWRRVWDRWFGETLHVLPRTADRLPPDLNHLVLQALILTALGLALAALWCGWRGSESGA